VTDAVSPRTPVVKNRRGTRTWLTTKKSRGILTVLYLEPSGGGAGGAIRERYRVPDS
jgi:hypothetical protein